MSAQYEDIQKELRDLKKLLHGDPTTGRGGLAHNVLAMADDIYGTERNPGGLVADVNTLKKFIWVMAGVVTALQFGIQILFHFWKP
jgi:hypothetical protein